VGAFAYGVTVVIGRELAERGMPTATALGVRFAIAAVLLTVLLLLRRVAVVPGRGELVRLLLLGAIGYAIESAFFYSALQRGTAAAVALLFYAFPAIVAVIEIARGRERPDRTTLVALALAVAGTAVVVATGARVSISATGIVFALASAAVFAVYLLVGREFGQRTDAMRAAAWIAGGAAASNVVRGVFTGEVRNPAPEIWLLVVYGAATAAAFGLMFAALKRIGAARTAVVMTLEAVTAVVLGALFLHERITFTQVVGGAAILVAAATIGRREPQAAAATSELIE
jgi:drug/metabolite transporter (DMT)-like permease